MAKRSAINHDLIFDYPHIHIDILHRKESRAALLFAGLALVIAFAIFNPHSLSLVQACVLFGLGILIGILDVPRSEQVSFLLASFGIMIVTSVSFQNIPTIGIYIKALLMNLGILLSPAVVMVSLKIIGRLFRESRDGLKKV